MICTTPTTLTAAECQTCSGVGFIRRARCGRCGGTGASAVGRFDRATRTLTIPSVRKGCDCRYLITEHAAGFFSGRTFRLTKLDTGTDAEEDSYTVALAASDREHQCSCKGFLAHAGPDPARPVLCKHAREIRELLLAGVLDAAAV